MTTTLPQTATPPYRQRASTVVAALGSDEKQGLATAEVQERLQIYGRNELPVEAPVPGWRKFLSQFKDPLTILLLVAIVISFVAWIIEGAESLPYEAGAILAIVLLNALLSYFQENRAEHAAAALQAMSSPHARLLRGGQQQQVPAAEVAPGDIMLIEEGDTLPADGRVLESIALRISESALTGESSAVSKDRAPLDTEVSIADQSNMVFSGTSVAAGRGRAIVTATGSATELGKIAGSLRHSEAEETPLQKELGWIGRVLGIVVIAIAVVISVTILFVNEVRTLQEVVDVLLLAVALAVAAVPEGLTATTTVVLSRGMQRMAKRNVIVRKLLAVETLGSTTVIASDKTGTLTKNQMTVRAVVTAGGRVDFTGSGYDPAGEVQQNGKPISDPDLLNELERTLGASALANNATLLEMEGGWTIQGDPTEGALLVAGRKLGLAQTDLQQRFTRIGEVPFSSERKLMSTTHVDRDRDGDRVKGDGVIVLVKGAPDVLLARCTHERVGEEARLLTTERRTEILASVERLAAEALRTIGTAYRRMGAEAARDLIDEEVEQELVFLGVIGMLDPPRSEARQSVAVAQQASIRVIMITGDHPTTAAAIASELGIVASGVQAVTGAQLQRMDEGGIRRALADTSVFARVDPEHKLRLVRALKERGEVVAMTGDGVNDAPALKLSDIGVAMGITGTDVSKGAADMILTDDNFASIVVSVEEGRSVFSNIQKFLRYLLSSNIGEVLVVFLGVVLAPVIGLLPGAEGVIVVPLLATQILWINLLTDAGPALALGVEPVSSDVMERPPRDPRSRVVGGQMWFDIVYVGLIMAVGTLLVMDWALPSGLIDGGSGTMVYAQTLAFTTLVFFQLFNVFSARSGELSAFHKLGSNQWLWLAVLVSVALQAAVIYTPFLQSAFGTMPLSVTDWVICIAVASSVLWLVELKKLVVRLAGNAAWRTSVSYRGQIAAPTVTLT